MTRKLRRFTKNIGKSLMNPSTNPISGKPKSDRDVSRAHALICLSFTILRTKHKKNFQSRAYFKNSPVGGKNNEFLRWSLSFRNSSSLQRSLASFLIRVDRHESRFSPVGYVNSTPVPFIPYSFSSLAKSMILCPKKIAIRSLPILNLISFVEWSAGYQRRATIVSSYKCYKD